MSIRATGAALDAEVAALETVPGIGAAFARALIDGGKVGTKTVVGYGSARAVVQAAVDAHGAALPGLTARQTADLKKAASSIEATLQQTYQEAFGWPSLAKGEAPRQLPTWPQPSGAWTPEAMQAEWPVSSWGRQQAAVADKMAALTRVEQRQRDMLEEERIRRGGYAPSAPAPIDPRLAEIRAAMQRTPEPAPPASSRHALARNLEAMSPSSFGRRYGAPSSWAAPSTLASRAAAPVERVAQPHVEQAIAEVGGPAPSRVAQARAAAAEAFERDPERIIFQTPTFPEALSFHPSALSVRPIGAVVPVVPVVPAPRVSVPPGVPIVPPSSAPASEPGPGIVELSAEPGSGCELEIAGDVQRVGEHRFRVGAPGAEAPAPVTPSDYDRKMSTCSREVLEDALRKTGGNRTHAARLLGMTRPGFYKAMARVGLA